MSQQLKLVRYNVSPPGGFKYLQPETKLWIYGGNIDDLERKVVAHRNANHLPVGTDIRGEIEQQICAGLGSEWCNRPAAGFFGAMTFKALLQGTSTLIDWALNGGQVPDDEADRRAKICSSCSMNQDGDGCSGCNVQTMTDLVARFTIKNPIPHDRYLKHCKICLCKLAIKVRVPLDIIHRHTPDEQMQLLPDWCWIKPELKAA